MDNKRIITGLNEIAHKELSPKKPVEVRVKYWACGCAYPFGDIPKRMLSKLKCIKCRR